MSYEKMPKKNRNRKYGNQKIDEFWCFVLNECLELHFKKRVDVVYLRLGFPAYHICLQTQDKTSFQRYKV